MKKKKTFGHVQTCCLMLWEYWKKKKKLYFRLLCKRSLLSLLLTFLLNLSARTRHFIFPSATDQFSFGPAMFAAWGKAEMCHVDMGHASAVKDNSTSTRKMEQVYTWTPFRLSISTNHCLNQNKISFWMGRFYVKHFCCDQASILIICFHVNIATF